MEKSSSRRDSDRDRDSSKHHHHRSKHADGEDRRRRSERERSEDGEKSYERELREDKIKRHHNNNTNNKRKDRDRDRDSEDDEEEKYYEKRARVSDERKERRRFEDKVAAAEDERDRIERKERVQNDDTVMKTDVGSNANGGAKELHSKAFGTPRDTQLAPSHPLPKVSLISTKHENEGVNSNRSHEVPGKSSTDGSSADAGKSGGISLDALSKAKATLLRQKELAEKMKKIPVLNKGANSSIERSGQIASNKVSKAPSSAGILPSLPPPVTGTGTTTSMQPPGSSVPQLAGLTGPKVEAVKRAQELAAKMGFRQDPEFAPLINMFPGQLPPDVTLQPKPAKTLFLRLDALGREVDEHGNVVNIAKPTNLSTLKVNINKQKKDAFQILKPELEVDPDKNPYFDPRMGIDKVKLLRPKKMTFQFVEEGKWAKEAEIIKLKSQFGEAQAREFRAKQAQLAKAKAEPDINPNLIEVSERIITKEKPKDPIPDVEWW